MKTIIVDIDGTITNMWPIEKSVLLYMTGGKLAKEIEALKLSGITDTYQIFVKVLKRKFSKTKYFDLYNKSFSMLLKNKELPSPRKYPIAKWISANKNNYRFVYATGGQKKETHYMLKRLNLVEYFDLENSIDKSTYRFSKRTGIPLREIKSKFGSCLLLTDSKNDCIGAKRAGIPFMLIRSGQKLVDIVSKFSRR